MSCLVAAEWLKIVRQRGAFFWGFLALPAFLTLVAFALESVAPVAAAGTPLAIEVHPIRSAMRALSIAGNPVAQLFFAAGAAAIFAVDYRYSTWRHLVPRRRRSALLAAKAAAFASLAAVSLTLILIGDAAASLVAPLARGFAMTDAAPATPVNLALAWLLSWLELVALGGTVAMLAVATRSALGAILPTFLLALAAATLEALLNLHGDALAMLLLPTLAADALRDWILGGTSAGAALVAAAALLAWSAATYGTALYLFARQDLAAE
jgi:hypothetical protein